MTELVTDWHLRDLWAATEKIDGTSLARASG